MSTQDWHIVRAFAQGESRDLDDRVVQEAPLEIRVNGMPLVALMRLPGQEKELAAGFCLTERVIPSAGAIELIRHCGTDAARPRDLNAPTESPDPLASGDVVEMQVASVENTGRFSETFVVRTGCGGADLAQIGADIDGAITSRMTVRGSVLLGLAGELTSRQPIFNGTGGTHGAGIFDAAGACIVVAEDVGRHNALDKAVGSCALTGIDLEDKVLVLSGRVSYEMAMKAVRVGIPIIASLAAPTHLGLQIAERAGCTVIGFLSSHRFNIYTRPDRVVS
ncbi:MAG: formate dehydrogenase accessory sulfurtransferase FdhD [Candidatus Geothermincolia bacterium]